GVSRVECCVFAAWLLLLRASLTRKSGADNRLCSFHPDRRRPIHPSDATPELGVPKTLSQCKPIPIAVAVRTGCLKGRQLVLRLPGSRLRATPGISSRFLETGKT